MSTNKNQHFVPRCHLRHFTVDRADKTINLIGVKAKRVILRAAVRHQCARDYFYGTDATLDDAIKSLESNYGRVLSHLQRYQRPLDATQRVVLRRFLLFQHLRTEAFADRILQDSQVMRNAAALPSEFTAMSRDAAVRLACQVFVDVMHVIDDLRICLVRNTSALPFVTSDNPAILTNRWLLERHPNRAHTFGLGAAGALLFLPLSPRLLLMAYDSDVYSVPHLYGTLKVSSARDIAAFNRHQVLQCFENIYFHDEHDATMLLADCGDAQRLRPPLQNNATVAHLDKRDGAYARYVISDVEQQPRAEESIIHIRSLHPNPHVWPSLIGIRRNGSVYTNGTALRYVRWQRTQQPSTRKFRRERP